jgi:hypothetical protein
VLLGSPDSVPASFKLRREQMVEVSLVESAIARRVSHFQGLPFFFNLIEGRIQREDVDVIVWVGDPIDWSCLAVNKLCVNHVWANAIVLLITLAHLGFHSGLDCRHRLSKASAIICSKILSSLTARYNDTDLGTLNVKS